MNGQYIYTPQIWPSILTVLLLITLSVYSWRHRNVPGAPLDLGDVLNLDPATVTLTVNAYACEAGVPTDAIETYAAGTTILQNLGDGYYQLNWKTDKAYVNSCRRLVLKIGDWSGDGFTALFQFKR